MARLRLEFSRRANGELTQTTDHAIKRFGEAVALAYARGLTAACERLCEFPEMAPECPGARKPTRVLTHRSHRIFYRVERDRILIVRILHHARAAPTAL